jgi:tetratricopeptide (TPR) repeat protein
MGDAYIRLRKYRDAIEVLEKVIELSKPEDVIYEAIGHCYDKLKNYAQARFYYRKATHLRQDDGKLFYKIACTYFNEGNWEKSIRQLDHALKLQRDQYEYLLLAGEAKMQLGQYREALQYLSSVVKVRPRNRGGWEALVRCLVRAEMWEEALEQNEAALAITQGHSLFKYYKAAILFETGQQKEALLQLEAAMEATPRLLRKFIELNPSILQKQPVVDLVARYKRNRSI